MVQPLEPPYFRAVDRHNLTNLDEAEAIRDGGKGGDIHNVKTVDISTETTEDHFRPGSRDRTGRGGR